MWLIICLFHSFQLKPKQPYPQHLLQDLFSSVPCTMFFLSILPWLQGYKFTQAHAVSRVNLS